MPLARNFLFNTQDKIFATGWNNKITAGEWEAFLDDFRETLAKFNVPPREQAELFAIVDTTRADIVV